MKDRTCSLDQAVAEAVADGATVALGGFLHYRHPMAAVREIVRQGRRDLRVISPIGGIDADMLIAAGAVDTVVFGFLSLEAVGIAPAFTRAVQDGTVQVSEFGDMTLCRALQGTQRRLPWMPVRSWLGSDMEAHHEGWPVELEHRPGSGERTRYWAAPSIPIDVCILHAPYASPCGEVLFWGEGYDSLMAKAADQVLVTADEVVSLRRLRDIGAEVSNGVRVANFTTRWVVERPLGAHPTSCYPHHTGDLLHEIAYAEAIAEGDWEGYRTGLGPDEETYVSGLDAEELALIRRRMEVGMALGRSLGEAS